MPARDAIGIIFDLDGTLIESAPAITATANAFLATLRLPSITNEETISFIGGGSPQFVRLMLEARDAYEARAFDEHFASFSAIYAAAAPELNHPFPGVEEALGALAALGHPLALCTNKPAAPTHRIVEALGWKELFSAVVAGDTLPVKKPDPAPLREAAKQVGCRSLLYVGDSEVDAATAKSAKEPFILFTEGYRKSSVDEITHAASFARYEHLGEIVLQLLVE